MAIKLKEIVKILEADGWYKTSTKGSHMHYKHPIKPGKVTIPNHGLNKDLSEFLTKSILRQAKIEL